MGEVRRRGTFDQRKAAAIKRNKEVEQQELAVKNIEPKPTKRTMQLLTMMEAIIMGGSNSLDCADAQSALGRQKQKPRVLANRRQPATCESSSRNRQKPCKDTVIFNDYKDVLA